jgi:glycosyltransferase involved in cell wall biosynthesis
MSRRIRIGQVLTNLHDGGIEKVVLQLATGLPRDRFEIKVYALIEDNPWINVFRDQGIPVEVVGATNRASIGALISNVQATLRLARMLHRDRIDIVSTHDFFPAVIGRVASLIAGIPHRVTTLHNTYHWFRWPHHAINRLLSLWTDAVVAVSGAAMQYSIEHDRLSDELYITIPNGIAAPMQAHPDARHELRHELGISSQAKVIGNVGTHSVRKGQKFLLEAVRRLEHTHPDIHVVIVGSARRHEAEISAELHAMAGSPALEGRVHFLADRHDMNRLYAGFDIFCMPSIAEGLSLASLEAMVAGCVCLYSDIAPFQEIVQHDREGLLFPVGDAIALSRSIQALLQDPPLAARLSAQARKTATERFLEPAMLESYDRLFTGIANGH